MNASGGAAAPLNDASEEYGATAPKHERQEDNNSSSHSHSQSSHPQSQSQSSTTRSSGATGGGSSNTGRSGQTSSQSTSHKSGQGSHGTHGSHANEGEHDLDQVSREKAERYVNLDEEDVDHAASQKREVSGAQRSSQRAPRDVGNKEDIEQIHGKASLESGNDRSQDGQKGQQNKGSSAGGQQGQSGSSGSQHGGHEEGSSEFDQEARHKAEKFVNLDDEN